MTFDTSIVVPLRSSSCLSPDLVLARPFPSVLTTMAFDHSRRRWFGTCPCRPVPRGLPSSVKQLHTTQPFSLSAFQPFSLSRSWRTMICNPYLIGLGKSSPSYRPYKPSAVESFSNIEERPTSFGMKNRGWIVSLSNEGGRGMRLYSSPNSGCVPNHPRRRRLRPYILRWPGPPDHRTRVLSNGV